MTVIRYKDQRNAEQIVIATASKQIVPISKKGLNEKKWFVGYKRDGRHKEILLARMGNEVVCNDTIRVLQKAIDNKENEFILDGMEYDRDFSKIMEEKE